MDMSSQPWAMPRSLPVPGSINIGKTFDEAAEAYLKAKGENKHLRRVMEYLHGRPLASIFPNDLIEMAIALYPTQSNATRNRQALCPASAVINYAYDWGWCSLIRLRRFRQEKPKRRRAASFEWMVLFLRQCDQDNLSHLAALAVFINRTAARVSEAVNLKWDQVDLINRKVVLLKTKTGTNAVRHSSDDIICRLHEMNRRSGERVFSFTNRHSVNERIKAVCRRAGIEYLPTHSVGRRAFAKNTVAMGIDTKSAMEAGGWLSSKVFLETYVQSDDGGKIVADRFNQHRYGVI